MDTTSGRASSIEGPGVVPVIRGPEGMRVLKAVKFTFLVTNNAIENEALLAGLELARKADVKSLIVYSDFNVLIQR